MAYKLKDVNGELVKLDGKEVMASDAVDVIKGVDIDKRTLRIIATDESVDRDGDIIMSKGWDFDNYKKNPVFLWAHDYGSVPLAAAVKIERKREPWRIVLTHKFPTAGLNPFADMILELYNEKVINAGSVGFFPFDMERLDMEDIEAADSKLPFAGMRFLAQELLEHSGCPVPANPNAVQDASKSLAVKTNWRKDGSVFVDFSNQARLDIIGEIKEIQEAGVEVEDIAKGKSMVQVVDDLEEEGATNDAVEVKDGENLISLATGNVFVYNKGNLKIEEIDQDDVEKVTSLEDFFEAITDEWFADGLDDQVKQYKDKFNQLVKAGAVLNKKNKARLKQVLGLVKEVLEDAGEDDDASQAQNDELTDESRSQSHLAEILRGDPPPKRQVQTVKQTTSQSTVKANLKKQIRLARLKRLKEKIDRVGKLFEKEK